MKLRLMQPGFETYTGQMGVVFFENGLSTADVRPIDAIRMAAVMTCEWDNGASPSVAQSILDNADTPAPTFVSGADGQHDREAAATAAAAPAVAAVVYTAEELEAIADKRGIRGLREIGDKVGVKGNAIRDLIEAIVAAGAAKE